MPTPTPLPNALPNDPTLRTHQGYFIPMTFPGLSATPPSRDDIELFKTPLGAMTLKKQYFVNVLLLFGGGILVIVGIIGLIIPSREQMVKSAETAAKVAAVG